MLSKRITTFNKQFVGVLISKGYHLSDHATSHLQDDDPLYDSVASDEDYATVSSSVEEVLHLKKFKDLFLRNLF